MKHLLVFITLLCGPYLAVAQQPAPKKPNIIIIVSDDHAYQAISAYGQGLMPTPAIDRIAKEGVRFDKAYVTNSICGPSRAVILTGKYSNKNGYKDNETSSFDPRQNSFAKELRKGGYQTAWIGKYHLGHKLEGFDHWQVLPGQGEYYNPDFLMMDGSTKRIEGYVSTVTEDLAESWLDQRDKDKPFCLVIGHKATHRVWLPDEQDYGRFDGKTFPIPPTFYDTYAGRKAAQQQEMSIAKDMQMGYDLKMFASYDSVREGAVKRMNAAQQARFRAYYEPIKKDLDARKLTGKALAEWKFQRYMRDYLSTAASLDRNIGRTLSYLDNHQLKDNTIVIYLSDQGFYLGEHGWFDKRWMYEESFRTPMVMRYPGVVRPGTVSDAFVLNLDIAPTMLQAAGLPVPPDMQGESMLPLLTGAKAKGRDAMYYHYYENGEHAVSPQFGVRTRRYKLIRFYKRVNDWELYDLQKDPQEMRNLYGQKGYEKITTDLKKQLSSLIDKYEDDEARQLMTAKTAAR
ncbi:sulfatase (plasmid) [Hymenobacter sp. NBH84]|uniref:sulfatase family protein n=1 Tax=Hymenobacter sp. NBH84 TaxID=2596915 RepID=UPI0016271F3B|nr:sulfatase [Hymenobacter sp. NBH84]QNE41960.1 sulfatase [Hymenobacter sp. NBH84]